MHSNLPPGVTESMLPGNRPEDEEHDRAWEKVEELFSDLDPREIIFAALAGKAAAQGTTEHRRQDTNGAVSDHELNEQMAPCPRGGSEELRSIMSVIRSGTIRMLNILINQIRADDHPSFEDYGYLVGAARLSAEDLKVFGERLAEREEAVSDEDSG